MHVELPRSLQGIFFDFLWESSKAWALPTETTALPLGVLSWHLDLTVWSTVRGEPRFDLAPSVVMSRPEVFRHHWERIVTVDLSHPLEMFRNGERWVILDGYHRLARHQLDGVDEVRARLHPSTCMDLIRREGKARDADG